MLFDFVRFVIAFTWRLVYLTEPNAGYYQLLFYASFERNLSDVSILWLFNEPKESGLRYYFFRQSPNVSYNAYSKYPNMEELCTPFDHINIPPVVLVETGTTPGVKEGGDLGSDVTKGSGQ